MFTNGEPKIKKTELNNIQDLEKYVGKEIGITDWFQITQDDINSFAKLTHDEQWIHTDIEKSKKYSPYKTTVAHGFFILSLSIKFIYETFNIKSVKMGVNYGLDRVRFMSPTFPEVILEHLFHLLMLKLVISLLSIKCLLNLNRKVKKNLFV